MRGRLLGSNGTEISVQYCGVSATEVYGYIANVSRCDVSVKWGSTVHVYQQNNYPTCMHKEEN